MVKKTSPYQRELYRLQTHFQVQLRNCVQFSSLRPRPSELNALRTAIKDIVFGASLKVRGRKIDMDEVGASLTLRHAIVDALDRVRSARRSSHEMWENATQEAAERLVGVVDTIVTMLLSGSDTHEEDDMDLLRREFTDALKQVKPAYDKLGAGYPEQRKLMARLEDIAANILNHQEAADSDRLQSEFDLAITAVGEARNIHSRRREIAQRVQHLASLVIEMAEEEEGSGEQAVPTDEVIAGLPIARTIGDVRREVEAIYARLDPLRLAFSAAVGSDAANTLSKELTSGLTQEEQGQKMLAIANHVHEVDRLFLVLAEGFNGLNRRLSMAAQDYADVDAHSLPLPADDPDLRETCTKIRGWLINAQDGREREHYVRDGVQCLLVWCRSYGLTEDSLPR